MKKLKKQLEVLRNEGYETVTIDSVLLWIHQIQNDERVKRLKLDL